MGVGTSEPTATMDSSQYAYREGYAANMGVITKNDESLNGRMVPTYAGITTTLAGDMATPNIVNVATINAKNAAAKLTGTSRTEAIDVPADKVAKINTILGTLLIFIDFEISLLIMPENFERIFSFN